MDLRWEKLGWAGRTVVLVVALICLVLQVPWWMTPTPPLSAPTPPPPARVEPGPIPAPTVPPTALPVGTPLHPPTPPAIPASNSFTTLEDYQQRRRSTLHTPEPENPGPAVRTPATELARVARTVRDYRAAFGSNPVGLNKEIVRTLLGDNPRAAKFLDPATAKLNAQGELLDDWGHPYFFHALSGTVMEVRSAGPDGRVFTPDDLVQ